MKFQKGNNTRDEVLAVIDAKTMHFPEAGCHLWVGAWNSDGYGTVNYKQAGWLVHRLVWTLRVGNIPTGMIIMHKCDTPACINPDHLSVGSMRDNMKDKQAKGRGKQPKGTANASAKLTEAQVRDILACGGSNVAAGKKHGVGASTVCEIRTGKTWAHVQ